MGLQSKWRNTSTVFKVTAVPAVLVGSAAVTYAGPVGIAVAGGAAAGVVAAGIVMSNKHVKADHIRALDRSVRPLTPLEALERATYHTEAHQKAAEQHGKRMKAAVDAGDKLTERRAKSIEKWAHSGRAPSKFQVRLDERRKSRIENLDKSADFSEERQNIARGRARLFGEEARRAQNAIRKLPPENRPTARQLRRIGADESKVGKAKGHERRRG